MASGALGLAPKNRYADAPRAPDYTIDQDWESYSEAEHHRWDRLYKRQCEILPGRACDAFLEALNKLKLSEGGVPHMERLSDRLEAITGWRIVPVADLVPDDVFFDHLANKRFPAAAFLRPEEEFDYLQEPDVFHDIFGHAPMLAEPAFAEFMQAYGKGGQSAGAKGQLHNLARLYWYTVEFGLIRTRDGMRIYGAGILSSPLESRFCLEDASPNQIAFDLERVMKTRYIIDDFQRSYFVIENFQTLLETCYQDFSSLYERVKHAEVLEPEAVIPGDVVWRRGSQAYFRNRKPSIL